MQVGLSSINASILQPPTSKLHKKFMHIDKNLLSADLSLSLKVHAAALHIPQTLMSYISSLYRSVQTIVVLLILVPLLTHELVSNVFQEHKITPRTHPGDNQCIIHCTKSTETAKITA